MLLRVVAVPVTLAAVVSFTTPAASPEDSTRGETIIVKMVDKSATEYAFEPANITVHHGDVVRFLQTSTTPHNVEFRDIPEGTTLNVERMGAFLTAPDQTYDVVIDESYARGEHKYVCTPHEFMGMVGSFTVAGGG